MADITMQLWEKDKQDLLAALSGEDAAHRKARLSIQRSSTVVPAVIRLLREHARIKDEHDRQMYKASALEHELDEADIQYADAMGSPRGATAKRRYIRADNALQKASTQQAKLYFAMRNITDGLVAAIARGSHLSVARGPVKVKASRGRKAYSRSKPRR